MAKRRHVLLSSGSSADGAVWTSRADMRKCQDLKASGTHLSIVVLALPGYFKLQIDLGALSSSNVAPETPSIHLGLPVRIRCSHHPTLSWGCMGDQRMVSAFTARPQ